MGSTASRTASAVYPCINATDNGRQGRGGASACCRQSRPLELIGCLRLLVGECRSETSIREHYAKVVTIVTTIADQRAVWPQSLCAQPITPCARSSGHASRSASHPGGHPA